MAMRCRLNAKKGRQRAVNDPSSSRGAGDATRCKSQREAAPPITLTDHVRKSMYN